MFIVRCGNKKEWKSPLKTFGRNEWTLNYQQKSLNLLRSYLGENKKKKSGFPLILLGRNEWTLNYQLKSP